MDIELTIAHYIETLAEKYKDRPAIHFRAAFRTFSFSYRDIHERCLAVANYLDRKGIGKGDRILIWSYNGQEYGSILLGCALSGVVAVPIDFSCKADFVRLIADKVGAKHLFHSKRRPYPSDAISHIHVEDFDRELAGVAIDKTDFGVEPRDTYEIVYTSGTTSDPKGVIITNRNLVTNILHCAQVLPIRDDHTFLSVLPLSHMFEQVAGFFYPLYHGCNVAYIHSRKSTAILEALQRRRVSIMVVVPAFLSLLRDGILREARAQSRERLFVRMLAFARRLPRPVRKFLFRGVHKKLGGRMEMFIAGGSALDPGLETFWRSLGYEVLQGYGLTEASPVVALATPRAHKLGSVGRGLPGQMIRLGPHNEIWIRGSNVTPGYYENPKENKARFEDGWYKTGDIGEIDNDGFLYIRGRVKNMIKSASGLNVYPEDIETVLNKTAGLKDSCVIGLEKDGDVHVHAVLLMEKGQSGSEEKLRSMIASVNRQLQPHQQIQGYTLWPHEDFPRTHTLKIKRGPVIDEVRQGKSSAELIRPASGDRIADLVAEVAHVDVQTVEAGANLVTDLGLDSIARVELAALLEEEFNVEIDESSLTAETCVSDLKEIIAAQQKEEMYYTFPRWARTGPARLLRFVLRLVAFRLPSLFSRATVQGAENLKDARMPVIFISNHVSHYDTVYILRALPRRFRRTAVAGAADLLFEMKPEYSWRKRVDVRIRRFLAAGLMNAFPLSRDVHVKKSFEYMGELIDDGWNVLLYPEGKLTTTGEMDRFRSGIGMLAQAMQVPVVPIRLDGLYPIVNYRSWLPHRFGRMRVIFGRPMEVESETPPEELAGRFQDAIRALG